MKFGPFGPAEIIAILLIVLLLFGARRLPDMARSIGQSVREFRKGIRDMKEDIERDDDEDRKNKKTKAEATNVSTASAPSSSSDPAEVKTAESKSA